MLGFLVLNWRWLLPSLVATALLVTLGIARIELADLRTADAKALLLATEAARAKDAQNAALAQQIEVAHADAAKATNNLADANRQLAATRGMRDRPRPGVSCTTAHSGSDPGAAAGSELSDELEQFLLAESKRADEAANYAVACHNWAVKVGRP